VLTMERAAGRCPTCQKDGRESTVQLVRAEEGLGSPAFVSSLWNGWMASNHVMRAIAKPHVQPGFLYLALRSRTFSFN
jgi:hypothetical protein